MDATPDTIEKHVADTVLERASDSLTLGGVEYPIAPPTLATIIMVSELSATLPPIDEENDNLLQEVLRNARHCHTLGRIAAVLLLGAKRVLENRQVPADAPKKRSYLSRILRLACRKKKNEPTVAEVDKVAQICLTELSPVVLRNIVARRLIDMQIADFFALTTSLSTANHLKPTREVEKATQSGE